MKHSARVSFAGRCRPLKGALFTAGMFCHLKYALLTVCSRAITVAKDRQVLLEGEDDALLHRM